MESHAVSIENFVSCVHTGRLFCSVVKSTDNQPKQSCLRFSKEIYQGQITSQLKVTYTANAVVFRKWWQIESLLGLLYTTNRKWYTAYWIAAITVIFKVMHSPTANLYKMIFCTVVQQLTRFQLTQRVARTLCGSWASCYAVLIIRTYFSRSL